jgi:hypothetical protein
MRKFVITLIVLSLMVVQLQAADFLLTTAFRGNAFQGKIDPGLVVSPAVKFGDYFLVKGKFGVQTNSERRALDRWLLVGGIEQNLNKASPQFFLSQTVGVLLIKNPVRPEYDSNFTTNLSGGMKIKFGNNSWIRLEAGNAIVRQGMGRFTITRQELKNWNHSFFWEIGLTFKF